MAEPEPWRLLPDPNDVPATVPAMQAALDKVQRRDERKLFLLPVTEAQVCAAENKCNLSVCRDS